MKLNDALNVIRRRRSVRGYRPGQIKDEELQAIIEAGIYAPTGHNDQPWHFTVVQDREKIAFMNQKAKEYMKDAPIDWMKKTAEDPKADITYGAPTFILISSREHAVSGQIDCCAAMENMLLAAESLDIGSVWLGLMYFFFMWEGAKGYLQIPEGYEPQYSAVFGYKAAPNRPAPARKMDVVTYIK